MPQTFPFQFFSGSSITPDVSNSNDIGSLSSVIANIYSNQISGTSITTTNLSVLGSLNLSGNAAVTTGISLGAGEPIFGGKTLNTLNFKQVSGLGTLSLSSTANVLTISGSQTLITGTAPILVTGSTIGVGVASSLTNGYLTSTDWSTFNNKQSAGNYVVSGTSTILTVLNTTSLTGTVGVFTALTGTTTNATVLNATTLTGTVINATTFTGTVINGTNITGSSVVATTSSFSPIVGGQMATGTTAVYTNVTGTTSVRSPYFVNTGLPQMSQLMWSGNTTVGTSGATNAFVAISGGTALSVTGNATYFTQTLTSPTRITYIGTPTVLVNVQGVLSYTGTSTTATAEFGILKNSSGTGFMPRIRQTFPKTAGDVNTISVNTMMSLVTNDTVAIGVSFPVANRIFVRNASLSVFVMH